MAWSQTGHTEQGRFVRLRQPLSDLIHRFARNDAGDVRGFPASEEHLVITVPVDGDLYFADCIAAFVEQRQLEYVPKTDRTAKIPHLAAHIGYVASSVRAHHVPLDEQLFGSEDGLLQGFHESRGLSPGTDHAGFFLLQEEIEIDGKLQIGEIDPFSPVEQRTGQNEDPWNRVGQGHGVLDRFRG